MRVLLVLLAPAFGLNGVVTRRELGAALGGGGALGAGAVAAAAAVPAGVGIRGADPNGDPYGLPALPFAYDALEPYIDAKTMEFHHDKHHAAYVATLNKALKGKGTPVALANLQKDALKAGGAVRNGGGGHYNHCLFFASLCAAEDSTGPSGAFNRAIVKEFGGEDALASAFKAEAAKVFGSGWAWLGVDRKGKLVVSSTANQDNPLMDGSSIPILGLDVWEHAYYLKYQNRRPEYVDAFFNVINWSRVSANYAQFASQGLAIPCTQGDLLAAPPRQF